MSDYPETDAALDNAETYEGTSGLLTGYVGEVIDAWFAPNDRFGGWQLFLKNQTDDASTPEWTEQFNVGGAWSSLDGGKTVVNTQQTNIRKFNNNSRVQKLLVAAVKAGAGDDLKKRGPAQNAAIWIGLRFQWDEVAEPYTMKDRETGKDVEGVSHYNLPSAFVGVADGSTATASSSASPSTASILPSLDEDLVAKLREVRASSDSHHAFCDKALTLPGVQGNIPLITALADEEQLWKELGE